MDQQPQGEESVESISFLARRSPRLKSKDAIHHNVLVNVAASHVGEVGNVIMPEKEVGSLETSSHQLNLSASCRTMSPYLKRTHRNCTQCKVKEGGNSCFGDASHGNLDTSEPTHSTQETEMSVKEVKRLILRLEREEKQQEREKRKRECVVIRERSESVRKQLLSDIEKEEKESRKTKNVRKRWTQEDELLLKNDKELMEKLDYVTDKYCHFCKLKKPRCFFPRLCRGNHRGDAHKFCGKCCVTHFTDTSFLNDWKCPVCYQFCSCNSCLQDHNWKSREGYVSMYLSIHLHIAYSQSESSVCNFLSVCVCVYIRMHVIQNM